MLILWIVPAILGWALGWVVNYLSDVLPVTRRFSPPVCLDCNAEYSIKDYLLFRPCSNGHTRKTRVWLVQFSMLALSLYIWSQPPSKIGYWAGLALLIYLGIVFVIDMEHRLILHPTSIAGSLLALVLGTISHGLVPTLTGGLAGLLIMLAFYYFGMLFARFRAKRMHAQGQEADDEEALGAGDVILVTVLGFLVGWPLIWFCILFSILLGGVVSFFLVISMLLTRRYETNALMRFIPYGPYFVIGAALIIFFPKFLAAIIPG